MKRTAVNGESMNLLQKNVRRRRILNLLKPILFFHHYPSMIVHVVQYVIDLYQMISLKYIQMLV